MPRLRRGESAIGSVSLRTATCCSSTLYEDVDVMAYSKIKPIKPMSPAQERYVPELVPVPAFDGPYGKEYGNEKAWRDSEKKFSQHDMDAAMKPLHAEIDRLRTLALSFEIAQPSQVSPQTPERPDPSTDPGVRRDVKHAGIGCDPVHPGAIVGWIQRDHAISPEEEAEIRARWARERRRRFIRFKDGFWFRLWFNAPGIHVLGRSHEPLWSERNGYIKFWPAWPARWRVRLLRPVQS